MPLKTGRSRADVAYDLETLLGVVVDEPAPASRRRKRASDRDHAIGVVVDRAGLRRKSPRRA
jgi:hypothetical protein